MGTGQSGRYLNTRGSGKHISDFALVHSDEGTFTYTPKGHHISKMKSGGHGQSNLNLLKHLGIKYNITKVFSNGVRLGNIPSHKTPLNVPEVIKHGFPPIGQKET